MWRMCGVCMYTCMLTGRARAAHKQIQAPHSHAHKDTSALVKTTQYGFSRILRRLLRFPPLGHTTNSEGGSVDLPTRSVYVMWHSRLQDKGRLPDCSWTNHEKPSTREPSCLRNAVPWPLNPTVLWILAWGKFFLKHLELMVENTGGCLTRRRDWAHPKLSH